MQNSEARKAGEMRTKANFDMAKPLAVVPPKPVCEHCGEPVIVDRALDVWVHLSTALIACVSFDREIA
jgi:hypothetical protein